MAKAGRIGFELFDKTNFGITDFAEQVNYRRAIEGELERSILAPIAEREFHLVEKSAVLSFIVVFGVTKALTNYVGTIGRTTQSTYLRDTTNENRGFV